MRSNAQPASKPGHAGSTSLLSDLKAAHRKIETAFAELEAGCGHDRANLSAFSATRMRVGQALLAKRQLVGLIASELISSASAYSQRASEIIGKWTPIAIQQDWNGYCTASRDLRTDILSLIAAEKELYYPLLLRIHAR
jgi:hypothetical protein